MQNNAVTTKTSQVSSDDFVCTRENVLWLLGSIDFYEQCQEFQQLQPVVKQLSEFIKTKGLGKSGPALGSNCTHCDGHKAMRAQGQLIDNFAKIFFWLYDRRKIKALRKVRAYASNKHGKPYKRILLAYSGPATKNKDRLAIVE